MSVSSSLVRGRGVSFLVLAAAILVLLSSGASAQSPDLDEGERIFKEVCYKCHGQGGEGMGLWEQPNFRRPSFWYSASKGDLMEQVRSGGEVMPGFEEDLSEGEMVSVLAYQAGLAGVEFENIGSPPENPEERATYSPADERGGVTGVESSGEAGSGGSSVPGFTLLAALFGSLVALSLRRR